MKHSLAVLLLMLAVAVAACSADPSPTPSGPCPTSAPTEVAAQVILEDAAQATISVSGAVSGEFAVELHGDAAPGLWRAAVDAFGFGHVYEEARSRWRLAEALLATGDRAGAAVEAGAAHAVAVRLGAVPLRTAVEALVRRGRLDVGLPGVARSADVAAVLTPREAEVLRLLALGLTNRQIGAELYISEKTASVHVSNIIAKLGAHGRTEAVAIAAAKGLLADR